MASGSGAAPAQEYKVRVMRPGANKRFSIMKFNASSKLDLAKDGPIVMERENNLKQYKNAHDVDILPKFGAGSEYGREQKDEARRKKLGVMLKRYDPNAQPWLMKAGKDKVRNFKGTREGSVSENTSYYIFTQCADGAFDVYPIEDWYTFNPVINYKYLNADEAEEIYEKRDKTFNFFNVMFRKRLKNEDDESVDAEEGETKTKAKSKKDLMLTEMEDWSDSDVDNDESGSDDGEKKAKKEKDDRKGKKDFRRKNSKKNDLDEAIEESDEGDYDDKEMDYITDPSSESETETKKNYDDGGVEDEDGLRKINESGDESEEEEKKEEEEGEKKEEAKKESGSESSGPSSGSDDSDPEDVGDLSSALFMSNVSMGVGRNNASMGKEPAAVVVRYKSENSAKVHESAMAALKKDKKGSSKENSASNSRSSTPVNSESIEKLGKKRKASDSPVVPAKKPAPSSTPEPPASPATSTDSRPAQASPLLISSAGGSDGISEESVRRYLMRKPMTTKELLQKFKSKTNMSNEQLVITLGQVLKKLNPDKKMIKEKMYLSMKK